MNYFFLETTYKDAGFIDGDVEFLPKLNEYYGVGINIQATTNICVKMDSHVRKLKKDFFGTGCGAFFASEELALTISKKDESVAIYPAECFYSTGKCTEKKFMLVHIKTGKIDGFDYFESNYNGKKMTLERIKNGFKPNLIKGASKIKINFQDDISHDYFFLSQLLHLNPIISEDLLKEIKGKGFSINVIPV